jgi:hypothetical protein
MFRQDSHRPVSTQEGTKRRDFLRAGALGAMPMALGAAPSSGASCILVMMVGGPSQLDTFDPKPDAPSEIRGPFRPIRTNVSGMRISEIFPRLARHADKFSLIRSLHHSGPAVHDAGHHLMQTGRPFSNEIEQPSYGSVVSHLLGGRNGMPAHVLLPKPVGATGGNMPHGDGPAYLGQAHAPFLLNGEPGALPERAYLASLGRAGLAAALDNARLREAFDLRREPASVRDRYGRNRFGQSCLLARRLVEAGVRFVTVNQFETVFDEVTWDSHGAAPFSSMAHYRDVVGPMFDTAYSALLEDLALRGLLSSTIVAGLGEFGRTPRINAAGGRDHWTHCYSALLGGGPLRNGLVVGASDRTASEPKDRPVTPAELAATLYKGMGIPLSAELRPGLPVVDPSAAPIAELLG